MLLLCGTAWASPWDGSCLLYPCSTDTEHLQGGPEDVGLGKSPTVVRKIFIPFSFLLFSQHSCSWTRSGVQRETRPGCSAPTRANFRFQLLCPGTILLYKGGMNIQKCGNSVVTVRYLQPHWRLRSTGKHCPDVGSCVGMETDGYCSHGLLWTGYFCVDRGSAGWRLETSSAPL